MLPLCRCCSQTLLPSAPSKLQSPSRLSAVQTLSQAPIQKLLPPEVMLLIFSQLPIASTARAQCSCRQWYRLGLAPDLWRTACQEAFQRCSYKRNSWLLRREYRCAAGVPCTPAHFAAAPCPPQEGQLQMQMLALQVQRWGALPGTPTCRCTLGTSKTSEAQLLRGSLLRRMSSGVLSCCECAHLGSALASQLQICKLALTGCWPCHCSCSNTTRPAMLQRLLEENVPG